MCPCKDKGHQHSGLHQQQDSQEAKGSYPRGCIYDTVFSLRYKLEGVQQRPKEMTWGWAGALNVQRYGERTELLVRSKSGGEILLFSDTQWQDIEKTEPDSEPIKGKKSIPGELQNLTGPCPEQCDIALLLVILWAGHWTRNLPRILPAYKVVWSTQDTSQSSHSF